MKNSIQKICNGMKSITVLAPQNIGVPQNIGLKKKAICSPKIAFYAMKWLSVLNQI